MSQSAYKADRPAPSPAAMTPMMAQYFEIKGINPGFLLFYRMGDFYELFFEDAEIASRALGITLTRRGKHQDEDIPMCGVPVHAAQDYLRKLIALGHRVAVCEQTEDPAEARKRGSKSVVRREVVRLVTPGTLTEDDLLPARASNFLAALAMLRHGEADFALAWADISTGELFVADLPAEALADELARLEPAELLVSANTLERLGETQGGAQPWLSGATILDAAAFDSEAGAERLRATFAPGALDPTAFSRVARSALGALVGYVAETQKQAGIALRTPQSQRTDAHMSIDAATRASLELLTTNRGEARGALLHGIDMTVTAPGARLFAARLAAPLVSAAAIEKRLEIVARVCADTTLAARLRTHLKAAPDISRALTRIELERGGPRDLAAIGKGIDAAIALSGVLSSLDSPPEGLAALAEGLGQAPTDLAGLLGSALSAELPLLSRDGGFVAEGFDPELDTQRALGRETRTVVAGLQADLCTRTTIKSLRIKHNNVLGFFIEVPAAHGPRLLEPDMEGEFIHRQTMANAMRFTTGELADLEGRIARAHQTALEIEAAIFARLREAVLANTARLRALADAMAELDVHAALATLASEQGYARPTITEALDFAIEGGRHPVVEQTLVRQARSFVANDCDLSGPLDSQETGGRLWLVTGPNMGGKSTFLRQNALIAIMAQMGSFVPARAARIGVVDRVFSRVGASDDIAQGRSTFMVEMVETAAILNRATSRSLVILDEIGRGTATFDGLSIAWACVETLHETTRCRGLFATHYHELTALGGMLDRVSNHTMKVREWEGEVVFLHEVVAGVADRSYGIQVARLAGLPAPVIDRARAVLDLLEARGQADPQSVLADLPLFARASAPPPARSAPQPRDNRLRDMVSGVRPDDMTPREALEWIYGLKKAADADDHR
ncbi:DNA mismatch repair protein MutS [Pelagibacterium montanilacus]|uniref:DNA mismatch repair protein MutS n=1 Tax=Pelagibacterium montanilacus TaxID=2185280 RepID=UPI000F8E7CF2|nr:DNA mismatch repair protein MutS [Pelagibacterium montanilacus]